MADARLDALHASVVRLRGLVEPMTVEDLERPAYPSEWTIADVLSHIGSGAEIMRRRVDDVLAGRDTPEDFAPGVWDEWNAKPPAAKRDDALTADAGLVARLEAVTPEERARFAFPMGPITANFEVFVGLRLNEHAFHSWDIEVVDDPVATIPEPSAELVIDNLELIGTYAAHPTGDTATIAVRTTAPARAFTVELAPESVTFHALPSVGSADVELPAEAFARLVYGRLDPEHTPSDVDGAAIDTLRRVYPGI